MRIGNGVNATKWLASVPIGLLGWVKVFSFSRGLFCPACLEREKSKARSWEELPMTVTDQSFKT